MAVARAAWRERKRLDSPFRPLLHEAEFLPAAVALQESPVSPLPRVVMWVLIAFALIATLWAMIGKIDMVASVEGKIIGGDRTKVIQAFDTASVEAIHITDGQVVDRGDPLIDLDATIAAAEVARLGNDLLEAQLRIARSNAFLAAMAGLPAAARAGCTQTGAAPAEFTKVPGASSGRLAAERRLLDGQLAEYGAKLAQFEAQHAAKTAELNALAETARQLEQRVPLVRRRAADLKALAGQHFVDEHSYFDREEIRISLEGDLATAKARITEVKAGIVEIERNGAAFTAETRHQSLDELHETEQAAATLDQELAKALQRDSLMHLRSPVKGRVQQLAVHTLGGVVTEAQPLMVIVPSDDPLEVEGYVKNKDVGFVRRGQEAEVKIETFPFTKYGTIPGNVSFVSDDAAEDKQRGLVYQARVRLARSTMPVDGKTVHLTPGMSVTVEIKTGKRRLIEYFLSPLLRYQDESFRER